MNVFFKKFVPAVLAVAALTSCSTDDLQGAFSEVFGSSEGDLKVAVEDLQDETTGTTRAAFIKTGNVLKWQKDVDTISVYNSSLFVYDWYAFNGSTFEIDDLGPYVDEAAYALFPKSSVVTTAWDRLTGKVTAAIEIPQQLSYSEDNATVKDSVIYLSNIPMWGTAENDGEKGKVKATMYYTTGILKVTLKNAFSNQGSVDALLIRGWKDLNDGNATADANIEGGTGNVTAGDMQMCGGFLATLNKEVPQNTQLVATEEDATTSGNGKLYVDLQNMVDTTTVVYIPVPANTYGHLIISAGKATRDAKGKITDFTSKEVLKHYSNKEIVRAKIYAGTNKEYEKGTAIQNTGNTPKLVNALLKDFASNKGDVRITDNGTGLSVKTTADENKDDIIEIPNMTCDTLFLAPTKIVEGGTSSTLTIKDAEGAAYAGAVVVEVPQTAINIDIQLKKGITEKLYVEVTVTSPDSSQGGEKEATAIIAGSHTRQMQKM